tara:strand:+ start:1292 stop:2020 length:729 start_codon:yes stop_codon:yes gene_type:complete
MKSHYCDIIEFEKNESFNELCTLGTDELKQCDREIDIIVNNSRLSLEESDYVAHTPSRVISNYNTRDGLTLKEELLLKTWMKKSFGYRWLHSKASTHYKQIDNYFTYPIVFISSIFGMGGFALIGIDPTDINETPTWENILNYVIAFINLIVATFIMIQKVNKYAEKAEAHRITATQYTKFYREINLELSLEQNDIDTIKLCRTMKAKYDDLLDNAPEIPRCVIHKFNLLYKNSIIKPDIIR